MKNVRVAFWAEGSDFEKVLQQKEAAGRPVQVKKKERDDLAPGWKLIQAIGVGRR